MGCKFTLFKYKLDSLICNMSSKTKHWIRNRVHFQPKIEIHQLIARLGSLWLVDIAADYDFVDTCPHVEVFFVGLSITLPLAVKN